MGSFERSPLPKILHEVRSDEPGSDRWRVYSSDGRHLIWISDGPDSFRYEYRGVPPGSTRAPINKDAGEVFYSERTAGPWLAKIIAARLLGLRPVERVAVSSAMWLTGLSLSQFVESDSRQVKVEESVLVGLTSAALEGSSWARAQVASIGDEEGAALAAFVWEFQEQAFVKNIILVSSIGELLGKDVPGADGDLLIGSVRKSLRSRLIKRGVDEQAAGDASTEGRSRNALPAELFRRAPPARAREQVAGAKRGPTKRSTRTGRHPDTRLCCLKLREVDDGD